MRRTQPSAGLDLVPIMNLVTILIPFLLFSAQFVTLATIDTAIPSFAPTPDPEPDPAEPLGLRIHIEADGYLVTAAARTDPEELSIPCTRPGCADAASYDRRELSAALARIKRNWPNEDTVALVPHSGASYELLIATMDAARQDGRTELFPSVVVAGGN